MRSQIIVLDPIPTLDKVCSSVLREETQRNFLIQGQPVLESTTMVVMSDENKKYKKEKMRLLVTTPCFICLSLSNK
ncbi:Uncharacterized protein TCM_020462 [Theobroma cacao]|uniref:Uncharacterized protein n=1 Tax=Theobroma cacao TaxID=3641 RepID=A0A061ELA9_THECC|nr:Uncharacterized protein TCM_020462 [Theobroma cacao]